MSKKIEFSEKEIEEFRRLTNGWGSGYGDGYIKHDFGVGYGDGYFDDNSEDKG